MFQAVILLGSMLEALVYGRIPTTPLVVEQDTQKIDQILALVHMSHNQALKLHSFIFNSLDREGRKVEHI